MNKLTLKPALWIAVALLFSGLVQAEQDEYAGLQKPPQPGDFGQNSSWAIAFDNDILVPGSRDQDYTYGLNITYAGKHARHHWSSLHGSIDWLNLKLGLDDLTGPGIAADKIEFGLYGFTPEDIGQASANPDDRPYASLVYASATREIYQPASDVSWQSTLTLGVLGLNLVGEVQNAVHSSYGGTEARGWDNQISSGGELTARYSLSRQSLLYKSGGGTEIKSTLQGSVGYLTEASWGLSIRSGKIHTPWVSFNPELTSYGERSVPNDYAVLSERYFWAGIAFKYRAYNAFLEGQFRDSDVTYDGDEINRGIVEAWLGYTVALGDGYSFTYSLRGHSSELNEGEGDRNVLWGGVLISKNMS